MTKCEAVSLMGSGNRKGTLGKTCVKPAVQLIKCTNLDFSVVTSVPC